MNSIHQAGVFSGSKSRDHEISRNLAVADTKVSGNYAHAIVDVMT